MAGLECIGTEHHQLTDAEEKGALRSAGLRGAQESDPEEQPDYLLLDILQHVPTEKAERLLSCLSERERALEDVLRRNRELVGSCELLPFSQGLPRLQALAAGAPAPPPDALGSASCGTDSASSCGANTPRCWRGSCGHASPDEPAPEKWPRAGPTPRKSAAEPLGLGLPSLGVPLLQGPGADAQGAVPLESAVQKLEVNHQVLAALVLHLNSSVGALDLLPSAGGLGGAAGGRGALALGGVAQGKAPPGPFLQKERSWAQRVEALEAQLAQVGGAADSPQTPRMRADPQRHLARQVLQKEHSWAQRVGALEARLAQVQAEHERSSARRGAQRSPRELSTPRERRLRHAFSSPRLGSSWPDFGFGDSPLSARRGAHRSPLSPPWEGWRASPSPPAASSPAADLAGDLPPPPPRASNARAGQLLSARQRSRGQLQQKAAQPADGVRSQPAAATAAAWGLADFLRTSTSAAAMWEATARLLSSGRAAAEPEDAAGSSSSSSCSSSSSSLSDTEPL